MGKAAAHAINPALDERPSAAPARVIEALETLIVSGDGIVLETT
jgi:hypothetical protein